MILIIDNYDSFTYNIYHYFGEIGAESNVYRNDKINVDEIIKLNPKAIVLSPGPCTPNEAGICMDIVKKLHCKFPILGICLGHQSIGQAFGGNIIQCSEIIHGKICKIQHNNHKLFIGINKIFSATRYHSLIIEKKSLNSDFEIIAQADNNIIMGIAHKKFSTYGVQFHPESIGTKYGKTILKNFLNIINYGS
jgi:anthranilate synthase component 2